MLKRAMLLYCTPTFFVMEDGLKASLGFMGVDLRPPAAARQSWRYVEGIFMQA